MNNIVSHGRLTKDPVLGHFGDGKCVVKFTVAVDRSYTNGNGEKQADFFNCVAFNKQAETIDKFFKKGAGITVRGEMQNNRYTDKDGNAKDFWQINIEKFDFELSKGEPVQRNEVDVDFTEVSDIDDDLLPF